MHTSLKSRIKKYQEKKTATLFHNDAGFTLLELVIAVGVLLALSTGFFAAAAEVQKTSQQALVNKTVNEVYTKAVAEYNANENQFDNPAFLTADEWIQSSDNETPKGVDLRGFLVDVDNNGDYYITDDTSGTIVIVGVAKGLGYDKDGYPYFYWKTELKDMDKAKMWELIQKHNQYIEEHKNQSKSN